MAAKKSPPRKTRGRPSRFKEEYVEQVVKLARLGLTDAEMADVFGVCEKTFNNWKTSHPDFLQSIKKGKVISDAEVANSLYERAIGAEWVEEQAFKVKVDQYLERIEVVEVRKQAPPDTAAAFIWLKNRKADKWRDKPDPSVEDESAKPSSVKVEVVNARKRDS